MAGCVLLLASFIVSAQQPPGQSRQSNSTDELLERLDRRPVNRLKQSFTDRTEEIAVSLDHRAKAEIRYSDWKLEDESFQGVHTKRAEARRFFQKDTTYLRVTVADRSVDWVGLGTPVVIRESEDTLYLVVFDRETDFAQIRFRFFAERHNGFHEIPAREFPGGVAVQNMWLEDRDKTLVANLDIAATGFSESLTARMWRQILTATEYFEDPSPVPSEHLQQFVAKYKPQPLQISAAP